MGGRPPARGAGGDELVAVGLIADAADAAGGVRSAAARAAKAKTLCNILNDALTSVRISEHPLQLSPGEGSRRLLSVSVVPRHSELCGAFSRASFRRLMTRALVLICSLVASFAFAQGKTLKDKEEIKFNEIERGFTIEAAAGWAPIFNLPGNAISFDSVTGRNVGCKRGGASLSNQVIRVELGADIGKRGDDPRSAVPLMVVTAMMQAGQARAGTDYLGTSSREEAGLGCQSTATDDTNTIKSPTGDIAMLGAGLAAKVNIIGFADSQDVKRLWVYARVAGGVNFFFPREIIKQTDFMLQAGAGVEYYTRLRHFAIGLEANFQMLFVTTTFGVTVTPTLRYSF